MGGQYVSNNVKTSLGPVGLDRMLTKDIIGDIDAATVLRMLRRWGVKQPATNVFDITRNPVTACQAASKNIKTSLGPVGLDRMLTNDIIGDMTITTDAATILRMLRRWGVKHQATKTRERMRGQVSI
ncbi:PREDICTED: T-complex protein 1 subunit alpha-like isoform X2 [Camelina sativa]|uniref:T-complex protein 1 subunit alpha-like isoform X2 n=1 Tax=Camelina sativa TaxID=90675 RepID=A0ABM0ZMA9_CAMSA|nr:PREDICTED: T-complex protein 1 subunit alpha-like isoform X2 [Camelina sativa]